MTSSRLLQRAVLSLKTVIADELVLPSTRLLLAPETAKHASRGPSGTAPLMLDLHSHVPSHRLFRSCAALLGNVDVEIQSMGESITEGSIAEVLKSKGDSVAEDEVIAQIETDKVTIDIKAPVSGKLLDLKVKPEDTVKVGQLVALIAEGEGGDEAQPSPAKDNDEEKTSTQQADQPSSNAEEHKEESPPPNKASTSSERDHDQQPETQRRPSIKFPQRYLPDGRKVSDLSAEERKKLQDDSGPEQPPTSTQQPEKPQERPTRMPWYVGKEQGTKLSQSRVLSQREMEQIELGGAEP